MRFLHAFGFTARDPNEADPDAQARHFMAAQVSARDEGPGEKVEGGGMAQCAHCNRPVLVVFRTHRRYLTNIIRNLGESEGLFGGEGLIAITGIWPPQPQADQDPHWPEEASRHFKDAQNMMTGGISPSTVIGVCRTVLDLLTKKLGASSGTLYDRIGALKASGKITEPIAAWAHSLRLDGNAAVHEGIGDQADAREYIEFLRVFMNVTFTLPARIDEKRALKGKS